MKFIKMLVLLILFLCGIVFFIQNSIFITYKIALNFDFMGTKWQSEPIPLYVYLLCAFALGAILTFLYLLTEKLRLSSEVKNLKSRVSQLEQQLEAYSDEGTEYSESEEQGEEY